VFTLFWPLNIKTGFIDDSNRHHIPQKKSGLSDFQYIGKHLNTYMSCIAKS